MNTTGVTQLERMGPAVANAKRTPVKTTPAHTREDNRHAVKGRLPGGSQFTMTSDATTRTWCGKLTVNGREYIGAASGVFTLLAALDEMYRAEKYSASTK